VDEERARDTSSERESESADREREWRVREWESEEAEAEGEKVKRQKVREWETESGKGGNDFWVSEFRPLHVVIKKLLFFATSIVSTGSIPRVGVKVTLLFSFILRFFHIKSFGVCWFLSFMFGVSHILSIIIVLFLDISPEPTIIL